MSDLFVGEILILLLLAPTLLRPFFRPLQRLSGIAALPSVALLLAVAVLLGDRFRLSYAPVLLLTVLVFLVSIPRLYRLVAGLPSDWYGAGTKALYGLLIVLFCGVAWASRAYAPELAWAPSVALTESRKTVDLGSGRVARVRRLERAESGSGAIALFLGEAAIGERSTAAQCLAEAGYRVTEAAFSGRLALRVPETAFSPRQVGDLVSRLCALRGISLPGSGAASAPTDILALARALRRETGERAPLFVFAEGRGVPIALAAYGEEPSLFAGIACLVPGDETLTVSGAARLEGSTGFMSANAARSPILLFSGEPGDLYGFGEIGADDPLAAAVAGGSRDPGRKLAELTARRVLAWFETRR